MSQVLQDGVSGQSTMNTLACLYSLKLVKFQAVLLAYRHSKQLHLCL